MINIRALLIVIQLFVVNTLVAQDLNDALGGVKTDFQIFSGTVDLDVSDQMIILKAKKRHEADFSFGHGWGYGYQSYHLEFIANKYFKVETFKHRTGGNNASRLEVIFYDSNNIILASSFIPFDNVLVFSNPPINMGPFFYSIDLIDIPIVLLNKTSKISMIKKVSSRNQ